jgi:TolB-like protein/Tfp pilus assembly protein PilF
MATLVLLAAGLVWEGVGQHRTVVRPPSAVLEGIAETEASVTSIARPVIAVLPFKNLSDEPESNYFVDGLTDEVIRNLAAIQGLRVRSRTSSFAFKHKPRNLRDVAQQLSVNLVVEGSVLRSNGRLRVNAQLIRVDGDVPVWSDRFDRELKDVFAIQDEISRAIVDKLRLTLGRGQRRYDTNAEAYGLYLKGRALLERRGVPSLEQAAEAFKQAIVKDPAFAPAHAGLANAYALMSAPVFSTISFETSRAIVRTGAIKARELDPLLADAEAAMGWMYSYEHDWANAEKSFLRAIELNPSLTHAYTSYSYSTLEPTLRLDDALRVLDVALRNDPLSLDVQREIGAVQFYAGRYRDAVETFQRILTVDPDFPFADSWLGRALLLGGRLNEAVPLLDGLDGHHLGRFKPARTRHPAYLALAYVTSGRQADEEALLAEHQDDPSSMVFIYAALRDRDRTFDALERLTAVKPHQVPRVLMEPELAVLRGDSRLAAVRRRFGLPPE